MATYTQADQIVIIKGSLRKVLQMLYMMHDRSLLQLAVPLAYLALIVIPCKNRRAFLSPLFAFVEGIIVVCIGHRFTPSKKARSHIPLPNLPSTLYHETFMKFTVMFQEYGLPHRVAGKLSAPSGSSSQLPPSTATALREGNRDKSVVYVLTSQAA